MPSLALLRLPLSPITCHPTTCPHMPLLAAFLRDMHGVEQRPQSHEERANSSPGSSLSCPQMNRAIMERLHACCAP